MLGSDSYRYCCGMALWRPTYGAESLCCDVHILIHILAPARLGVQEADVPVSRQFGWSRSPGPEQRTVSSLDCYLKTNILTSFQFHWAINGGNNSGHRICSCGPCCSYCDPHCCQSGVGEVGLRCIPTVVSDPIPYCRGKFLNDIVQQWHIRAPHDIYRWSNSYHAKSLLACGHQWSHRDFGVPHQNRVESLRRVSYQSSSSFRDQELCEGLWGLGWRR